MNNLETSLKRTTTINRKTSKFLRKLHRQRFLFMMMFPAVLIVFIFNYVTLTGWIIAFKNYQVGISIWKVPWIGLYQFKAFFLQSDDYIYLIRNTLVMNISTIMINLIVSLSFAILLNEVRNKRFGKIVQTVSFFPFFISWVIVYSIMHALFAASTGAVNETLINLGIIREGVNLLGDERFSWGLIIGMQLWKYLGYNGVIFIASIASIPADQFEAAEIDGAGRFGKIFHITIPNLMPTFVVLLIMNTGWVLNSDFDLFFLFTNPTNWQKMEVLDMYIYKYGLQLGNFSYATAVGIIKTIVSLILIISANAMARRLTGKSIL